MGKLEVTLDSLRQSQLWLSNSLRLLADSVNTDQNERDVLVYEVKEKVQSMGWRLSALEDKVSRLQEQIAAQGMRDNQITDRLDALHVRLLALEGVQQGTAHEPSVAELRQDICDQLLRMATLLGNKQYEEPVSPIEAQIRAAQDVARVLRSPARSVGTSRAASPAPSVHF
jgi:chromosome segregation ATPase